MKRETLFLKAVVLIVGALILALCIFLVPIIAKEMIEYFSWRVVPVFAAIYAAAIPLFFALYETLKLLSYIDENKAFSDLSVKSLKHIKYSAITISGLYAICMPFFFAMAEFDDAPGLVAFGMAPIIASIVIAVFAAVVQKLLKNAVEIKSENDLTV